MALLPVPNGFALPVDEAFFQWLHSLGYAGLICGLPLGYAAWHFQMTLWLAVCLIIVVLSLLAVLYRAGRNLDIVSREIQTWSWWPGHVTRTQDLSRASTVKLWREPVVMERGRHQDCYDLYHLGVTVDVQAIPLASYLDSLEARVTAERLCRTLDLSFQNHLVDPPETRKPDQLDLPLKDRLEPFPEPTRPSSLQAEYRPESGGLVVRIPPLMKPGSDNLIVPIFVTCLGGTFFWYVQEGFLSGLIGALFPALVSSPIWWNWLKASRLQETIRLGKGLLEVESPYRGGRIPLSRLEDLELHAFQSHGKKFRRGMERYFTCGYLSARSDQAEVRFGGGLQREELEYLRDLLRSELSRQP